MMDSDEELDFWPPEPLPAKAKEPSVSRSVHGAYHALGRRLHAATREYGLGASEALILAHLLREPGCAAAVIRHALGLHRSTLSSLLDRLQGKGLISRPRSSWDGRRLEIDLTPAGRIAAEIIDTVIHDVDDELAEFTSPAQRRGAEAVFAACVAIAPPGGRLDI